MSNFNQVGYDLPFGLPPMGRSARAHLHRATRHAHSWNAPARRERILLKFFPGANSRAENKKAGQNFYRSDLLKLLVAGTGFEPMTFGL